MGLDLSYSLADQDFRSTKSLGVWNVSTQLLKHLAQHSDIARLTVFTNREQRSLSVPDQVRQIQHNLPISSKLGRIYWDQWGVYSAAKRSGHPWLFLPKGFASAVRRCPVRLAAYVHDTMHSFYERHYIGSPLADEAAYFKRSLKATLSQAEIIFTNTEFTKGEIQRLANDWNIVPPRLVCAGIGFDPTEAKPDVDRTRIVVLVGPWPHKSTPLAIERLEQWVRRRGFAGGVDWIGTLPPNTALPDLPNSRHHTRLSPADYNQVLSRAAAVVYFSAYEGFGMPPVEGTLAGAAAVYSAIPSMTEAMGDCGFGFSNESYEEFAKAMDGALDVSRHTMDRWGDQLRARHNWPQVTNRIIHALQEVETCRAEQESRMSVLKGQAKKVLVFAHTPPPHHGQSFMVKRMIDGFGGDLRNPRNKPNEFKIACYHVNVRLSRNLEDVGAARLAKLGTLLRFCLIALWCRIRYSPDTFYYVPAPGKQAAVVRDLLALALCRPFFPRLVYHWHAAGLGEWVNHAAGPITRTLARKLIGKPDLSIIISDFNRKDAEAFQSKNIRRVNYGIPDPCPDFDTTLLEARAARAEQFAAALNAPGEPSEAPIFTLLYLANCLRTKGIFDALEAFLLLRGQLMSEPRALRTAFLVGGAFGSTQDEFLFRQRANESGAAADINYLGFVSGETKDKALRKADLLCFPTYYEGENQPLVLIEALAYGLPAVTTTWRSIPDIFPPDYQALVAPQDVPAIATAMRAMMTFRNHKALREHFCQHYTLKAHLNNLAHAIGNIP